MNPSAFHPHQPSEPPRLSRRLRAGIGVASVLISTVVLSSVLLGLTATPGPVEAQAAAPAVAAQA